MQLFLKIPGRMVNSVQPDQTAPSGAVWSESALFAFFIRNFGVRSIGTLTVTSLIVM